jgi:hypothetical protein
MNPSIALLLSIAVILVLLRLKLAPGVAVLAGCLTLSLLVLPPSRTPTLMLETITSIATLRLIGIIFCSLALSKVMELKGLLLRLSHTLEAIGPKAALHLVPAIIGLVPMPAAPSYRPRPSRASSAASGSLRRSRPTSTSGSDTSGRPLFRCIPPSWRRASSLRFRSRRW